MRRHFRDECQKNQETGPSAVARVGSISPILVSAAQAERNQTQQDAMAHRVATDPRLDRAKCEFAKLFDAYLKQGQRGDGTPERRWRPWGSNEFAGVIGVSPNTVRNWRRPDRLIVPDGILPVLDTLFGNEPEFLHQRAALEIIWKQAKGIAPLDEESLSGQELNDIFLSTAALRRHPPSHRPFRQARRRT